MKKLLLISLTLLLSGCGIQNQTATTPGFAPNDGTPPPQKIVRDDISPEDSYQQRTKENDRIGEKRLCATDECKKAEAIRKSLLMQNNGINEDYINKHIDVRQSEIFDWDEGRSFSICYKLTVDRSVATTCDTFIIQINSGSEIYPDIKVPRGTLLSIEDIQKTIDGKAFEPHIVKGLKMADKLKYSSLEEAIKALEFAEKVQTSSPYTTEITDQGLLLHAGGERNESKNECSLLTINLVSGETSQAKGPCRVS